MIHNPLFAEKSGLRQVNVQKDLPDIGFRFEPKGLLKPTNKMDPVIYSINSYQFRYFGIFLAVGLVILFLLVRTNLKQAKIRFSKEEVLDWIIIIFLYGLIGARLTYVLMNANYYFGFHANWYDFFAIWRGGFTINGGILFSLFALWVLNRHKKPELTRLTDQIVAPVFIVLVFARMGNFINGEVFGVETEQWMGYIFLHGPASKRYTETPIHPVMLYEAVLYFLGFLVINAIRVGRFRNGFTTACALFWYSAIQISMGLIRVDSSTIFDINEEMVFGITGGLISVCIILFKRLYRRYPPSEKQFPSSRRWTL